MNAPSNRPSLGKLIGMVHLRPLPGAPGKADLDAVEAAARADALALADGGANALIIENLGDAPYFPDRVPPITIATMTRIARHIAERASLPFGVNVLRNDGAAALAIAAATGAAFIRVNVLTGARVSDQGILQGRAHELLRLRHQLGAEGVRILADVDVKHSAPLGGMPLEQEVADTLHRARADAIIVSGSGTGGSIDADVLRRVRAAAGAATIYAGSGVTPETVPQLSREVDGFIVGTWLKHDGDLGQPVDPARVRRLAEAVADAGSAR